MKYRTETLKILEIIKYKYLRGFDLTEHEYYILISYYENAKINKKLVNTYKKRLA